MRLPDSFSLSLTHTAFDPILRSVPTPAEVVVSHTELVVRLPDRFWRKTRAMAASAPRKPRNKNAVVESYLVQNPSPPHLPLSPRTTELFW